MLVLFVLAHWGHHLLSSLVPPLLPFIRDGLNIDIPSAAGLVSAFTISYGVSQFPSGWLADRFGKRLLVFLGVSGVALWGVLAGVSPNYGVMLVCMVLLGLFGGGYHPASAPAVSGLVEPKRQGWALGVHQLGGTLSNLTAPLVAAGLATWMSWRTALVIPGLIVIALGVVLFVLMGRAGIGRPSAPAEASHANGGIPFSTSTLVLFIIVGTAAQVFILSVSSFMALFMVDGLKEAAGAGAALMAVMYVGGIPAGPFSGYLADRVGSGRVLFIASIIAGPIIFFFSLAGSLWVTLLLLFVMGIMMYTVMPVSEAYIIGHTTPQNRSTVLGVYFAASRGGSGFLTLGIGFLIKTIGFHTAFGIAGAALFVVVSTCGLVLWFRRRQAASVPA